jgi:hypothetical protein
MATLTGNKVKDSYQSLLKISSGGATTTLKTVEDGFGVSTALKVSTDTVEVNSLKITTTPTVSSSENTVMVYDDATNEVKVRELNTSAFQNINSFSNIAVSGQNTVVADSGTDTLTLVAGSGMTITTNETTDTITFASSAGGGSAAIEEMFVARTGVDVPLTGTYQTLIIPAANNVSGSYHLGNSPQKLTRDALEGAYIENTSGNAIILHVDCSVAVQTGGNNKDVYLKLQKWTGSSWIDIGEFYQEVVHTTGTGGSDPATAMSFWGIFNVNDGQRLQILAKGESDTIIKAGSLFSFTVKTIGDIV